KAILGSGLAPRAVDPDGLRQYLNFQFCLGETTLFRGIRRLPPGHSLVWTAERGAQISSYWDLQFRIDSDSSDEGFRQRLLALLTDAVRLRLRADVPLGAHLSGGLDS